MVAVLAAAILVGDVASAPARQRPNRDHPERFQWVGRLQGDGAQVLPVVTKVEGIGELLARPQPAQPGLGAVQRSLGLLAVPPADRDDQGSVGQGELVQVAVVPAGKRVIDRLAELFERDGAAAISTRPGLGRKFPVCTPYTNSTVIAR